MSFEKIIGQPLAVQLAQRWLAKKTNQPLLFYGPEGAGKRTLAVEIAQVLNCQESPGVTACGKCLSCKKISGGKHPDVRILDMAYQAVVRGELLEKQQSLKIETVLEERKRLYQTPTEGTWKVSILDEAHRLTPDAANVLLKILEEPPVCTAIFLLTPYRDRLFATILSRCQPVRFRALSDKEKHTALTHEQIEAIRETDHLWEKLPQLSPGQVLALSPRSRTAASNRGEIESQIKGLLSPALRELRSGQRQAVQKVELLQRAQQQLRQNVPPALVYDQLLLQLSLQSKS